MKAGINGRANQRKKAGRHVPSAVPTEMWKETPSANPSVEMLNESGQVVS